MLDRLAKKEHHPQENKAANNKSKLAKFVKSLAARGKKLLSVLSGVFRT